VRRRGGTLAGGAVASNWRQGVPGEHQWGPGVASSNVEVGGAHLGSGLTVRGQKSGGSLAFRGGGGIR
jgi:hypothetical protein